MLNQRVILITGASRGLGRALFEHSLDAGHHAIGIVRSKQDCIHSGLIQADLGESTSLIAALEEAQDRFGRIDILINNAAIYPRDDVLNTPIERFSSAIHTNLIAAVSCAAAVIPGMLVHGYGRVLNVGSWVDRSPPTKSAAYAASKGALHAVTKAMSADLEAQRGGKDVQIHEWIPGRLATRMNDLGGISPSLAAEWGLNIAISSPSNRSAVYEEDREWLPPASRLRKLRHLLFNRLGQ